MFIEAHTHFSKPLGGEKKVTNYNKPWYKKYALSLYKTIKSF